MTRSSTPQKRKKIDKEGIHEFISHKSPPDIKTGCLQNGAPNYIHCTKNYIIHCTKILTKDVQETPWISWISGKNLDKNFVRFLQKKIIPNYFPTGIRWVPPSPPRGWWGVLGLTKKNQQRRFSRSPQSKQGAKTWAVPDRRTSRSSAPGNCRVNPPPLGDGSRRGPFLGLIDRAWASSIKQIGHMIRRR